MLSLTRENLPKLFELGHFHSVNLELVIPRFVRFVSFRVVSSRLMGSSRVVACRIVSPVWFRVASFVLEKTSVTNTSTCIGNAFPRAAPMRKFRTLSQCFLAPDEMMPEILSLQAALSHMYLSTPMTQVGVQIMKLEECGVSPNSTKLLFFSFCCWGLQM